MKKKEKHVILSGNQTYVFQFLVWYDNHYTTEAAMLATWPL